MSYQWGSSAEPMFAVKMKAGVEWYWVFPNPNPKPQAQQDNLFGGFYQPSWDPVFAIGDDVIQNALREDWHEVEILYKHYIEECWKPEPGFKIQDITLKSKADADRVFLDAISTYREDADTFKIAEILNNPPSYRESKVLDFREIK